MFKFKGISSNDMQVVVEEEEHFVAKAAQRYEATEIEGKDGALFDTSGYSYVERPILVQCLNINKIDDILAWLNGEGEFEYKGRKTIARFYSELDPKRSACIRIIDTTFIRDPFWNKANDEFEIVKDRKDKQVSGEYIQLNDSSNMPYEDFKINGKSEQETREEIPMQETDEEKILTVRDVNVINRLQISGNSWQKINDQGKNLLKDDDPENPDANYSDSGGGTTPVTYSVENEGFTTEIHRAKKFFPKEVGTYMFSIYLKDKPETVTSTSLRVVLYFPNAHGIGSNPPISNSEYQRYYIKIEITEENIETGINIVFHGNVYWKDMMLEKIDSLTDEPTEYEPYIPAMPSPEFPSEIRNCGDNVNLFDKEKAMRGYELDNTTGEVVQNAAGFVSDYINVKGIKNIHITKVSDWGSSNWFYDENKKPISKISKMYGDLEVPIGSSYYRFNSRINDIDNVKVEKGKKATPYSEYGKGTVEVIQRGKNLIDITKHTNDLEAAVTIIDSNKYTLNLDELGENKKWQGVVDVNFNNLEKNTEYVISFDFNNTKPYGIVKGDNNTIIEHYIDGYPDGLSFNTGEYENILIRISATGGIDTEKLTGIATISNVQLEKGITKTTFEPYHGKEVVIQTEPLRSLPSEVRDVKNKDKTTRNVGYKEFDGTENSWAISNTIYYRYPIGINILEIDNCLEWQNIDDNKLYGEGNLLCNRFIYENTNESAYSSLHKFTMRKSYGIATLWFYIPKTFFTATTADEILAEWKAKLVEWKEEGNPLKICYKLAEPIIEEESCEELANIEIYNPMTIFSDDEISPYFKLYYNYIPAMPSPEAPSEIRSVADDVNEFNPNEELSNGYKAFYAKESVSSSDIGNNIFQHYAQNTRCKAYFRIKAGQTRVFKLFKENYKIFAARYANEEGVIEDRIAFIDNSSKVCKYTATKDGYVFLSLVKLDGSVFTDEEAENLKNNIKICEKEPVSYSEYGKGTVEVTNCNRNLGNADLLFKQMKEFDSNNCREEIVDNRNCIVFSNWAYHSGGGFRGLQGRYKENTQYRLKFKARPYDTSVLNNGLFIVFNYTDNTYKNAGWRVNGENWIENELISDPNKTIDYISTSYSSNIFWCMDKDTFIIEEYIEGQETEYIPNEEQNIVIQTKPLCSLPNGVCDVKDKDKTVRNVGRIVLDGINNQVSFAKTDNSTFIIASHINSKIKKLSDDNQLAAMSNKLIATTINNIWSGKVIGGVAQGSNNPYIQISLPYLDIIGTTNESINKWLSTNPITVDYELAEPIIEAEPCEELLNIGGYKGVTNITSGGEVKPNLDVRYIQLTDELILNIGNIESRPIIRLRRTIFDLVELTINNIRFIYHFNNDDYVDIDCKEKTVEYKGINRNRQIEIGYEFPKLNIGNNKIIMHRGDCIVEIKGKDRWL